MLPLRGGEVAGGVLKAARIHLRQVRSSDNTGDTRRRRLARQSIKTQSLQCFVFLKSAASDTATAFLVDKSHYIIDICETLQQAAERLRSSS
jgi:hypothetical protein